MRIVMAWDTERTAWVGGQTAAAEIDVGLRAYMLRVYNYMASGVALTGLIAALVANSPAVTALFFQVGVNGRLGMTGLGWIATLSPLAIVLAFSFGIARMQAATAQGLYWLYAGLMGISMASIFFVYTGTSITRVFFISAASFAGLSLYGYTTKRNLSAFASFLIMGLIGVVVASLVNMFLMSSMLQFVISVVGVLVFAGLTAYDTQKIRDMYWVGDASEVASKKAVMGAFTLYLDFINLFIMLLRLFGDRRD
jgi:FtsH-binding integral membrane protein